jgi:hypothetical protein
MVGRFAPAAAHVGVLGPRMLDFCLKEQINTVQLQPSNEKMREYYTSHGFALTDTVHGIMTKQYPDSIIIIRGRNRKTRRAKRRSLNRHANVETETVTTLI